MPPFLVPAYRSAATTEGCSWAKKEPQRRKLHHVGPRTPGRHFPSRTVFPGKSYAALETPPADTHRQKSTTEQAADKCTDGDMATLITAVQQIMTGLQRIGLLSLREQFVVWLCANIRSCSTVGTPTPMQAISGHWCLDHTVQLTALVAVQLVPCLDPDHTASQPTRTRLE
jgi:hypothetical protein